MQTGATLWVVVWTCGVASAEPAEHSQPLSPQESLSRLEIPGDLELELVAAEPVIRQPVFLNFDERGRMWVVQYQQYPEPAGLTMLSRDKYWRAVYDKTPPPPPYHFRGQDKITIHEDRDGKGTFESATTFLEGLSIVTSVTRGRGGVWVLNPPYLLFYPDEDGDDVPDRDPDVHLTGFGLEDTHSVANSLRWGPDGWLYAAQGSTVSGNIMRPGLDTEPVHSMGQLIWRYHPETRRYEIFAEGGGNAFGVEIDSKGHIFSGHNGGDTRGFHYVQGGYYRKGFSKHGPLSNPYAFGYFPAMEHHQVPRFTHTFIIYEARALPQTYWGKLFGANPVRSHVVLGEITPDGSSFRTKDLLHVIEGRDEWFRPVDIKLGPGGAVYVADWYDRQVAHHRSHEGQIDSSNGRIYRLKAKGMRPTLPFDLRSRSTHELIDLLEHPNRWFRQTALRLIGDRKDSAVIPQLRKTVRRESGQLALEALWALNLSGGLDDDFALDALEHPNPDVRRWTVRLVGDPKRVASAVARKLRQRARIEPDVAVRSQLACTARRLPAGDGLPVVRELLARDEDASDKHIPLLLWWAMEAKAESDGDAVLTLFTETELWSRQIVREHILDRLMRRYAQAGSQKDLLTCARLFELALSADHARRLMNGFEQAFEGRAIPPLPERLTRVFARWNLGGSLAIRLRRGQPDAVEEALHIVTDHQADLRKRRQCIRILGEVDQPRCVPVLLEIVAQSADPELQRTALTALQRYDDREIGRRIAAMYADLPPEVRSTAQVVLASRSAWVQVFLKAIEAGRINRRSLPPDVIQQMRLFKQEPIPALVDKLWGEANNEGGVSENLRHVERLSRTIESASGDPYEGRKLFLTACGACHALFGEGGEVGPDLTSYKRDDLGYMLLHIVDPSAQIREGFEYTLVLATDGLVLSGVLAGQDRRTLSLRLTNGEAVLLDRDEIEAMRTLPRSVMPEGLLDPLEDQQVRDLFAYLRSTQPLNLEDQN